MGKGWGFWKLYRFYRDDDARVYRGRTRRPFVVRKAEHRLKAKWWTDVDESKTQVAHLGWMSEADANRLEMEDIAADGGTLANSVGNRGRGKTFRPRMAQPVRWDHEQPADRVLHWAALVVPLTFAAVFVVLLSACTVWALTR